MHVTSANWILSYKWEDNIVTCLLEARLVESERQSLLGNWSANTFPQLPTHVTTAADTHATTEELLELVFSVESVQRVYQDSLQAVFSHSGPEVVVRQLTPDGRCGRRGVPTAGSRCVATPSKVIEDLLCDIVNCKVCEFVKQL
jgi:hypothetical protein